MMFNRLQWFMIVSFFIGAVSGYVWGFSGSEAFADLIRSQVAAEKCIEASLTRFASEFSP